MGLSQSLSKLKKKNTKLQIQLTEDKIKKALNMKGVEFV